MRVSGRWMYNKGLELYLKALFQYMVLEADDFYFRLLRQTRYSTKSSHTITCHSRYKCLQFEP